MTNRNDEYISMEMTLKFLVRRKVSQRTPTTPIELSEAVRAVVNCVKIECLEGVILMETQWSLT